MREHGVSLTQLQLNSAFTEDHVAPVYLTVRYFINNKQQGLLGIILLGPVESTTARPF